MCHGQMIDDAIRRARKVQHCTRCRGRIEPGREYQRQVSKDGGDFQTYVACKTCACLNSVAWARYDNDVCIGDERDMDREIAKDYGWKKMLAEVRRASTRIFKQAAR